MPNKYIRYTIAFLLIIGLILVRKYEDSLFYDPFINYFRSLGHFTFPEIDIAKFNASTMLRFAINTLLTVLIIWFIYWNRNYVRFSILVLIVSFIILLPLYNYLISTKFSSGELIFFYVRRFLIQPIFVLILIPCFYYQELQHKKREEN